MMSRILSCFIMAAAFLVLANVSVQAGGGKAQDANVVSVEKGKITLTMPGNDQKHVHDVAKDAMIMVDSKTAKLEDLKEGFAAKVTMDAKSVVTMIDAKSKTK